MFSCNFGNFIWRKWQKLVQNGTKTEVTHHAHIGICTCQFGVTHLNFLYCFHAVLEPLCDENGKNWLKMAPNRKWHASPTLLLVHASSGWPKTTFYTVFLLFWNLYKMKMVKSGTKSRKMMPNRKWHATAHTYISIGKYKFGVTHLNFYYRFPAVLECLYVENGKKWHKMAQNDTKPGVAHHAHIFIDMCKFRVTHPNF